MWTHLKRVTAPPVNPITLNEAKDWLRVDGTEQDLMISTAIDAAVSFLDGPHGIGIALVEQKWDLFLDRFPVTIEIPLTPVQSVDEITYVDRDGNTQTLDTSVYKVSTNQRPAIVERAFGESWPVTRLEADAVKIRFTAGYAPSSGSPTDYTVNVPADLKAALKWLVTHMYEHPSPISNEGPEVLPFALQSIINRYAHGRIA